MTLLSAVPAAALARTLDGATIVNSGSTNTIGWRVALRSNGSGWVAAGRAGSEGGARTFSVSSRVAREFFADLHAARAAGSTGGHCMKSASFGSVLNVFWHGWRSPDLSCPATAAPLRSLAVDVQQIVAIARPPSGLRRIHFPVEPHRAPPTPGATP